MKDYTTKQIKELALEVTYESILKLNFNNESLTNKLKGHDPIVFISYYLKTSGMDMNRFFFLSQLAYWRTMNLKDWEALLSKIHNNSPAIYSFFEITYKYLELDFIHFYLKLDSVNTRKRYLCLKRLYNYPHNVQHDSEAVDLIAEYSFSLEEFKLIRTKLLKQGAKPADKVIPKQTTGTKSPSAVRPLSWDDWFAILNEGPSQNTEHPTSVERS